MLERLHARIRAADRLGLVAAASVVVAVVVVLLSSGSEPAQTVTRTVTASSLLAAQNSGQSKTAAPKHHGKQAQPAPGRHAPTTASNTGARTITVKNPVGQLIIGRFAGSVPTPSILNAVESGSIGGIILFSDNTAGGVGATAAVVQQLQAAARRGGNPGLLIMTDQEGGLVHRLPGPPTLAASQMGDPTVAAQQGAATARLLSAAGVNVDLAPVADVSRVNGFMTTEHRTFGSTPAMVASAACAFASQLAAGGVAYTLKHFPGLGDAVASTDTGPVTVTEPASLLHEDVAAYGRCGSGSMALVMVSSASYPSLTGTTPAVLSPTTYGSEMSRDGIDAITISDDFSTPAIANQASPALRAINAGLDLVMYAQAESASGAASQQLNRDLRSGTLSSARIRAAVDKVLALKRSLNLS